MSTTVAAAVETVDVTAYTVPTDAPESDGTYEWDSTTIVVVEARGGGEAGLGYTYCDTAAGALIESKLAPVVRLSLIQNSEPTRQAEISYSVI
jgi:hypothetical protein